jgi:hypothetical protein
MALRTGFFIFFALGIIGVILSEWTAQNISWTLGLFVHHAVHISWIFGAVINFFCSAFIFSLDAIITIVRIAIGQ